MDFQALLQSFHNYFNNPKVRSVDTMINSSKSLIIGALSIAMIVGLTGCSLGGLSDKEKAKYYRATDLVNSANVDYGNTYDKVIVAYFNSGLNPDKYLADMEGYVKEGLVSQELYDSCKSYSDYQNSMVDDTKVEYHTNGNPKTLSTFDPSTVFTMIEQLERGWIGKWMYAIPENDMNNVLRAYKNNNLLLDFENGTYQIVDYKTDVYGNVDGENDMSRGLDTSIDPNSSEPLYNSGNDGSLAIDSEIVESFTTPESAEGADETDDSGEVKNVTEYTIVKRDAFAGFIVYRMIEPKTQSQGNFTAVIENGMVVSIDGTF